MNSWSGLTAMMGDVWDQFARDVMDSGPFEKLKGNLRDFFHGLTVPNLMAVTIPWRKARHQP